MMVLNQKQPGFSLRLLLDGLAVQDDIPDLYINGICNDSRAIDIGDLFMAYKGHSHNGVDYIQSAINAGAVAVLINTEDLDDTIDIGEIPLIIVNDLNKKLGVIAARFYDNPSRNLKVVGITGTNGKTSVTFFIAQVLDYLNKDCGVIGTIGNGVFGDLNPSVNTTPDPILLQSLFSNYVRDGISMVAMEVSSQGLDQFRLAGTEFNIAVLTNLTEDHLDYHNTMDAYASAKKKLFKSNNLQFAVINNDDKFGKSLINDFDTNVKIYSYSLVDDFDNEKNNLVSARLLESNFDKLTLEINSPWGRSVLTTKLYGKFNAYNILAALTSLCLLGISFEKVLDGLSHVTGVPGRMELCDVPGYPTVVVDYAHTPDALKHVLRELNNITNKKLICVFGCGGNRDVEKRAVMGRIAETFADEVILTNDNPRYEPEENIIKDILAGVDNTSKFFIEPDRSLAINKAINNANNGDIVLIAGKGHETYQEIKGKRYPFNDIQLVRNLLEGNS